MRFRGSTLLCALSPLCCGARLETERPSSSLGAAFSLQGPVWKIKFRRFQNSGDQPAGRKCCPTRVGTQGRSWAWEPQPGQGGEHPRLGAPAVKRKPVSKDSRSPVNCLLPAWGPRPEVPACLTLLGWHLHPSSPGDTLR